MLEASSSGCACSLASCFCLLSQLHAPTTRYDMHTTPCFTHTGCNHKCEVSFSRLTALLHEVCVYVCSFGSVLRERLDRVARVREWKQEARPSAALVCNKCLHYCVFFPVIMVQAWAPLMAIIAACLRADKVSFLRVIAKCASCDFYGRIRC